MDQRKAQRGEKVEALEENVRILELLVAYKYGAITAMQFVERIGGAVPDPLAQ